MCNAIDLMNIIIFVRRNNIKKIIFIIILHKIINVNKLRDWVLKFITDSG
jgi:hypothetical protein